MRAVREIAEEVAAEWGGGPVDDDPRGFAVDVAERALYEFAQDQALKYLDGINEPPEIHVKRFGESHE